MRKTLYFLKISKNAFSILVLELKPTTTVGWQFFKFQKNSKSLHPNDEPFLDPIANICFFIGNHEIFNLVKDIHVKGPELYHLFYFIMYKLYKY